MIDVAVVDDNDIKDCGFLPLIVASIDRRKTIKIDPSLLTESLSSKTINCVSIGLDNLFMISLNDLKRMITARTTNKGDTNG